MKTTFNTNPHTGKTTLLIEAENDNERSLINRLMSRTMEERMTNCRLPERHLYCRSCSRICA